MRKKYTHNYHPPLETRFWSKVSKGESCWLWTGAITGRKRGNGYGAIAEDWPSRRMLPAHVVSFELSFGPVPPGLFVCHSCDVRLCVNPDHLFLGTHQDNMDDMHSKGRHAFGDRQGANLHPETLHRGDSHWTQQKPECLARGEQNGVAKLTEENVREIRRLYHVDGLRICDIMRVTGLPRSSVKGVTQGRTWRHVTGF